LVVNNAYVLALILQGLVLGGTTVLPRHCSTIFGVHSTFIITPSILRMQA